MNSTTTRQSGQTLSAAWEYAKKGWHVLPVHRSVNGVCTCNDKDECDPNKQGKHPATHHGFYDATSDEAAIKRWLWDNRNIGIRTGKESGLFVIDVDPRNDGNATLERLEAQLGPLPETLTVKTSGGGRHFYFRYTVELARAKRPSDWIGIDLKGDDGFVVAPPSQHPSGELYVSLNPRQLPAELPEKWLKAITGTRSVIENAESVEMADDVRGLQKRLEATSPSKAFQVSELVFKKILAATLPLAKGNRNKAVFQFAREIRSLPGGNETNPQDHRELVLRWHKAGQKAGVIGTDDPEVSLSDFYIGWTRIKFLKGEGPLADAIVAARTNPVPEVAKRYESKAVRSLVCLCREMQRLCPEKFYLSCYTAGDFLEIDPRQAYRYLKMLEAESVIKVIEPGTSGKKGKATRYQYLGD